MKRSGRAGLRGSPRGEQAGSCAVCAMRCGGCCWWCCCCQLRHVPTAGEDESGPQQPRAREAGCPFLSPHTQIPNQPTPYSTRLKECARVPDGRSKSWQSWAAGWATPCTPPPPPHTHQQGRASTGLTKKEFCACALARQNEGQNNVANLCNSWY
jgi:hypothetical protein